MGVPTFLSLQKLGRHFVCVVVHICHPSLMYTDTPKYFQRKKTQKGMNRVCICVRANMLWYNVLRESLPPRQRLELHGSQNAPDHHHHGRFYHHWKRASSKREERVWNLWRLALISCQRLTPNLFNLKLQLLLALWVYSKHTWPIMTVTLHRTVWP